MMATGEKTGILVQNRYSLCVVQDAQVIIIAMVNKSGSVCSVVYYLKQTLQTITAFIMTERSLMIFMILQSNQTPVIQGHSNLSDLSYGSTLCELILLTFLSPFSINSLHFCIIEVNNCIISIVAQVLGRTISWLDGTFSYPGLCTQEAQGLVN